MALGSEHLNVPCHVPAGAVPGTGALVHPRRLTRRDAEVGLTQVHQSSVVRPQFGRVVQGEARRIEPFVHQAWVGPVQLPRR